MPIKLQIYLSGRWQEGEGVETELRNPANGELLATASARKLDLASAFNHARTRGSPALQELSYLQRAKLLGQIADVLSKNRLRYEEIAIDNLGNTRSDAVVDIDGGIGTLKYYARLGASLGNARGLTDILYQRDGEIIAFVRPDVAVSGTGSWPVAQVVDIRAKSAV